MELTRAGHIVSFVSGFVLLGTLGSLASAGPLGPPAGPISSTPRFGPRTEITSLPYTIASSGSYYLGASLTGVAGANGIEVSAGDVDIDLNGFELIGVPGSLDGIAGVAGAAIGVTVHDGEVHNWGSYGVNLNGSERCHVYNIRAHHNGATGVDIGHDAIGSNIIATTNDVGIFATSNSQLTDCDAVGNLTGGIGAALTNLRNCHASLNGGRGIYLTGSCVAVECTAYSNDTEGFYAGEDCRLTNCTSLFNGYNGSGDGFLLRSHSSATGCTSQNNANDGYNLETNCRVVDCTAFRNGYSASSGNGFTLLSGSSAQGCTANSNYDIGFASLGLANSATDCTATSNGAAAGSGNGFDAFERLVGCTARDNASDGFSLVPNGRATDCTANANGFVASGGNGFVVAGGSTLNGCAASGNFASGFFSVGESDSAHDCVATSNGLGAGIGNGFMNFQRLNNCTANNNATDGINMLLGVVKSCVANGNGDDGIEAINAQVESSQTFDNGDSGIVGTESLVKDNSCSRNAVNGITVTISCDVTGNHCDANSVDGVHVAGAGNNIEGNHLVNNLDGAIDTITDAAGLANTVVSNRETGNPLGFDLDFVANTVGAIVLGPASPVQTFPPTGQDHLVNISY